VGVRTGAVGSTSAGSSSAVATAAAAAAAAAGVAEGAAAAAAAAAPAAAAVAPARKAATARASVVQHDEALQDVGEDEFLPVEWIPGEDEHVKWHRLYRLDVVLTASDNDPDEEENSTTGGGHCHVLGADDARYGVSLLQAAVDDTAIASVLTSADTVDALLGRTIPYAAEAARREQLCDKLSKDLMMLQLYIEQVRGPTFVLWARRDGAVLRDIERAAGRLCHLLICKLIACREGGDVASA